MNKKAAVIIPSYKAILTTNEEISLKQARCVLKNYDIYFILPNSLEITYGCKEISEKRYKDKYFQSAYAYSKFMLEPQVYIDFKDYEYILVYQLDAFVFEDRLDEFCDLGYDYIGAPWPFGLYFKKNENQYMWHVGNGGLSLRNVNAFIQWTKKKAFEQYIDYINEDILIASYGEPILNIAPIDTALSFSFESGCGWCWEKTKGKIPFGCHAWEKYDFENWKPIIEKYGYSVDTHSKNEEDTNDFMCAKTRFLAKKYTKNEFLKFLPASYENSKEGVYIWGGGHAGIAFMHKLLENGIMIAGFIDSDKSKRNKKILSYEIYEAQKILESKDKKAIVIAVYHKSTEKEIERLLQGYEKGTDYVLLRDIIMNLMEDIR